ncbi:cytochrome c, partial [Tateyamaria sp. syn59]|uniref:c-type cytochrome n=1 Tax=Tateyamaria sp. syn59 TaxID=2576942 RepID=UPI0011BF9AC3
MFRSTRLMFAGFGLAAVASMAMAQQVEPERAHNLRNGHMHLLGLNIGVLGAMAKGEQEYDADAAAAAAANIAALASIDQRLYWPEGSSSEDLEDSRALPAIWENMDDFTAQNEDLHEAAMTMEGAAGTDLASLQG